MVSASLTPEDWIQAAFRRLGAGGIAAVKAEVIARDLKVSKGSFYWHFKGLADLKEQMLRHWEDQATQRIITLSNAAGNRLMTLLSLVTSDLADPYGGLSTEAAIREWARVDPLAAEAQARTDKTREAYLEEALSDVMESGADRAARILFLIYTGAVHLGVEDTQRLGDDLGHLAGLLLGANGKEEPTNK